MKHAIIAIEDQRFYTNNGVDLRGIGRALVPGRRSPSRRSRAGRRSPSSSSRTRSPPRTSRTLFEKLREAALAYHITRKWSKEQDPAQLPQHDLLRQRRLRHRVGRPHLLRQRSTRAARPTAHARAPPQLEPQEAALLAGMVAVAERATTRSRTRQAAKRAPRPGAPADARAAATSPARSTTPRSPSRSRRARDDPAAARGDASTRTSPRGSSSRSSTSSAAARPARARRSRAACTIQTTIDVAAPAGRRQRDPSRGCRTSGGPRASLVAIDNKTGEVRAMVGGDDYDTHAVQPRHPGPAPARLGVQAVRARRGAQEGHLPRAPCGRRASWSFNVPRLEASTFTVENYNNAYAGVTTLAHATTFSDNSVFAQVGDQGRHQARSRGWRADGHPHAGLAQLRDRRSAASSRA